MKRLHTTLLAIGLACSAATGLAQDTMKKDEMAKEAPKKP